MAARSSVVVITVSLPCARAVPAANSTTPPTSAATTNPLVLMVLLPSHIPFPGLDARNATPEPRSLDRMRAVRANREHELEQEFVGRLPGRAVRVPILRAHLAELAGAEG